MVRQVFEYEAPHIEGLFHIDKAGFLNRKEDTMSIRAYEEVIAKLKELRAYEALNELLKIEVNPDKRRVLLNYM